MSTAPLLRRPQDQDGRNRLATGTTQRRAAAPTQARIARRRWLITWTKRSLPLVAVLLLASVALWPELNRAGDAGRIAFRRTFGGELDAARLTGPQYRGVDARGRPYTITADTATQVTAERINLDEPKEDITLDSGSWLMVQSHQGVFIQHTEQLDLSGNVFLYRSDGTTLHTETAAMDLKTGDGAGSEMTHAEGPFGTLDAQGFALTDKGAVIQFHGPAHLVLNNGGK